MKALNVLLAIVMSFLVAAAVLEGGLRLLGMGPQPTINKFDPKLGWVKTPGTTAHRKTGEFDVTFQINSLGLRDDEMASPAKPAGVRRVLMLGDSFVLGYTVDRSDLFVDLLESWWKAEGRPIDVINAGTEGYSTDQEVAWLLEHGREYQPDLVLLFPYENDLYWNAKTAYDRYPKPRFNPEGELEHLVLADPGPPPAMDRFAMGRLLRGFTKRHESWTPNGETRLPMEWVAYFRSDPEPMPQVKERTRGALSTLKKQCAELGAELCVVPIPNKACIEPGAKEKLSEAMQPNWIGRTLFDRKGVDPATWSPDLPVETFLGICNQLGIATIDPRHELRTSLEYVPTSDRRLYYERDWHLNPAGNRVLARILHDELDRRELLEPARAAAELRPQAREPASLGWLKLFALLWAVLSIGWILTYRGEPAWQAPLKVGVMLGLIFTIALGGGWVLQQLPPEVSRWLLLTFVLGLLGFIFWKLGRRLGTIVELFACFVGRGHWYLIPLVVVLLSVGSLLVVAASSPLVAPFIYTLF